jgi:light-regulated signal transduction histidine kinase (bacteriophytochrome)
MVNLIGNAWKYSAKRELSTIEFGTEEVEGKKTYYVRDNGIGFEMSQAGKLFGVFQRLQNDDEFEGFGIGLATVQRIIQRHGGNIYAESELDKGATFFFTLGEEKSELKPDHP